MSTTVDAIIICRKQSKNVNNQLNSSRTQSMVTVYIRHGTAATEHGTLLDIGQFHRTFRGDRVNPSRGRRPIGGPSMPTRLTDHGLRCGLCRPVVYQGPCSTRSLLSSQIFYYYYYKTLSALKMLRFFSKASFLIGKLI